MDKEKVLLFVGCSHAAGAEMDGSFESDYNRKNSFGNLLADHLGYRAINLGSAGCTNSTIARSVIEWVEKHYDPSVMDLFVLTAWTESTRIEIPAQNPIWYHEADRYADFTSKTYHYYHRVNLGLTEADGFPSDILTYQKFMAENETFLQIYSANLVLQLQYFLKEKNIDYLMCNTMHMFDKNDYINFYLKQIDQNRYIDAFQNDKVFYWYYRNNGYENPKAQYWHHNEIPHKLYAEKLFNFINQSF